MTQLARATIVGDEPGRRVARAQVADFGDIDIISAGAISQTTLYALMRLPRVQISARIFDNEVTGASNLNRNMLTLIDALERAAPLIFPLV